MRSNTSPQKTAFLIIGLIWVISGFIIGIRTFVFLWGAILLILSYFLYRLLDEITRLADATEKIAEQSNYSNKDDRLDF